jgi:hypothetical protein
MTVHLNKESRKEDTKMKRRLALMGILVLLLMLPSWRAVPAACAGGDNPVASLIRVLEVGRPVSHKGLTIIPVYTRKVFDRNAYLTLEEALKMKWVEVTEVENGRVPQVKISNLSKHVLFLLGGEILTGARQDRILAQDVLLAPGTKNLLVPVFCVEQGRWTYTSRSFTSKSNLGTYKLRAKAAEQAPAAQSEIWNEVRAQNEKLDVASGTSAYQDAYDKEENKAAISGIERKMNENLRLADDTVGVVIGLGGRIVSMDVFANAALFKKQWPKILRSSALSALQGCSSGHISQKVAADFLKGLAGKEYKRKAALDLGYELETSDSAVMVKALNYKEAVIHMSGFPQGEDRIKIGDSPDQRLPVIRQEQPFR